MKIARMPLILFCTLLCLRCSAQAEGNPVSLGEANFDLMEMDFHERVEVLLGNANHYRTSIQEGASVIAYNFIVSKKQDRNIRVSLGGLDISPYRYEFKATPAQDLIGVSVSFVTRQDLRPQIIEAIERREKQNRVDVGSLPGHPAVYRWESKDKVIHFAFATAEKDNVYTISILSKEYDCSNFPLERVFVGEDICLKEYPSN